LSQDCTADTFSVQWNKEKLLRVIKGMHVPQNAFVLVADGRKWILFRNDGVGNEISLRTDSHEERQDRKDSEIKSDAPGTQHQRFGSAQPAMEETDFHQLEEDQFASDIAAMMKVRSQASDFGHLIVIAPPHTLGTLRTKWHENVATRIIGEIPKDLTDHPVKDIEALLTEETDPPG
jgi:protein required for attachment to host cells